jgi:nucleoid-associated protein YgaU
MTLAKLTILVETGLNTFNAPIDVLFNPNQITIQKTANWRTVPAAERDVPMSQFTHGEPATLTMDLFFDTYEKQVDVRIYTNQIFYLMTVQKHGEFHRPPLCRLQWGAFNFDDYEWILQNLNQRFTLFLANGSPVRATLSCTFKQWRSNEVEARLQDRRSADVAKVYTVRRGDTLSSIAAQEYRDPMLWRPIARENKIHDPRRELKPGQTLKIPILRPSHSQRS